MALLALLVILLMLLPLMSAETRLWQTRLRRERETELLFVGDQYARALAAYRDAEPIRAYPKTLAELVDDRRGLTPRHHLRRLYRDPLTGSADWGLVYDGDRRIVGLYSLAAGRPFKQNGFAPAYRAFAGSASYRGWLFAPPQAPAGGGNGPP